MTISIIIVSYNVRYLLEQCLYSVKKAIAFVPGQRPKTSEPNSLEQPLSALLAEIIVVDNNSRDDSIVYLLPLFPNVKFIVNKENNGFAKANNQGLAFATGKYILFQNPDTILPEDFFVRSVSVLEQNPRIGAAGVQMINGKGLFLQESKRGIPGVWASFCKLSGLTALFPTSKIFARYYLGHLNKNSNHEVEILSGACMLITKEVLDTTQSFDERFFMYAEDIDLSFRIIQSGFSNYYLADTTIIHFKGESTVRDFRYVKLFYRAMIQFVGKHYTGIAGSLYAILLKMAIWFRALFSFGSIHLRSNKPETTDDNVRAFFLGDPETIAKLKGRIDRPFVVTDRPAEANEIYLCEGPHFSFREIIEIMKLSPGRNYKIIHSNEKVPY